MLKFYFKTAHIIGIVGISYLLFSFSTIATTFNYYPQWYVSGGTAATCVFNLPELAPLSVPRTLVVDNHLPNNTELYSWGYNEFIPNINGHCIPNGSNTNISYAKAGWLNIYPSDFSSHTSGYYTTNIPGIGIKIYYKYTSRGRGQYINYSTRLGINGGWLPDTAPLNTEYQLLSGGYSSYIIGNEFYADRNNTTPYNYYYSYEAHHVGYSLRAALIKTGNITYNPATPLTLRATVSFGNNQGDGWTPVPNLIGSGGITIIPPACRLSGATDYAIGMGRWTHAGPGSHQTGVSLPAYGQAKPVNISLECSGSLDNVYFRFEDTGTSPLSNKNVSLYDNGGTRIDGLEIEMLYGGNRINVDNSTKTNVGAQGAVKTNPADISFSSQSTVPFTARYVQRSAIQKGGVSYTGTITGRVNMYVTYQ